MQYSLYYSGTRQGFCPLKMTITQFPSGFRLNSFKGGSRIFLYGGFTTKEWRN